MKILAVEFSSEVRSVSVAESIEGSTTILSKATESGSRNVQAFGMVRRALKEAQVERGQIQCIAVGLGPGSYAGIRAAIAFAQGWQLAQDVKLLGISSAQALAHHAGAERRAGEVAVVIDAQRNEFYVTRYAIEAGVAKELQPLHIASRNEVAAIAEAGIPLIGPEAEQYFPAQGTMAYPDAAAVAKLAACRTDFVPGDKLTPIYLRPANFVKVTSRGPA